MNLTNEQEAMLIRMQSAMKMSELYAQHWIAMATTGASSRRCVWQGDRKLTPEELVDEALETAKGHIHRIEEITRNIGLLLEGRETEIDS